MFSLKWKLLGAVMLAVILAIMVGYNKWRANTLRRENKKRAMSACAEKRHTTIFVMLVSYKDAVGAANTLLSLFGAADCPLRVYVGLYEFYEDAALTPAVDVYESLVASAPAVAFSMQDQIRVLRAPASEFKSGMLAREHLQRYLYRGEQYVLTLGQPCSLARNWDTYLLSSWTRLGNAQAVLTTLPERGSGTPSTNAAGTFVAMGSFSGAYPTMVSYRFKQKRIPDVPVPALAWAAGLSFHKGRFPFPPAKTITYLSDVEDFMQTVYLLENGWRLYHPAKQVAIAYMAQQRDTKPSPEYAVPAKVFHRFGVRAGKTVTARARVGLTAAPNKESEINAKLGSMGEYLSMLSRLESRKH